MALCAITNGDYGPSLFDLSMKETDHAEVSITQPKSTDGVVCGTEEVILLSIPQHKILGVILRAGSMKIELTFR